MTNALESDFNTAMLEVYTRAKTEAKYAAVRFLQMVVERGGVATARYLLREPTISAGYAALYERGRLDLTVERVVLDPRWRDLFTRAELQVAVKRLGEYGYSSPLPEVDLE
jgi:hypothetical protein